MSNLGLERFLNGLGITLERTAVGDRMWLNGCVRVVNLGGEQSGHIVMTDYSTTGDGLMAGLQFWPKWCVQGKRRVSLQHLYPRSTVVKNVRYQAGQTPLEIPAVQASIANAEAQLDGKGRLLIRKSGTEPLIRVMAECEDAALLEETVDTVVASVEEATR